ncbi:sodium:proton exchanger [Sphingomonas koreensis]|uniref:Sodium:proton exchanger n=1 Tax=Sphingomonas koreensis TaxID=93064 RepID=A0A430FXV6_9SPHN|nr:cation:proton antiporter [Sphingomonas koreensis]RSY76558.1 sodium:proton exchanger [Sphingomonas koreensis]
MLHHFLADAVILIFASLAFVALFTKFRLSSIAGYLVAGSVVGPYGLHLVSANEGTRFLGELGIAALMFVIGFEFSWPRIVAARRLVFVLGTLQVVVTALLVAGVALLAGLSLTASLILGFALAHSSSAIVHKQLLDQDEVTTSHGIATTGILLFQDLAALPVLLLVGAVASGAEQDLAGLMLRLGAAVLVFTGAALFARKTIGRIFDWIARSGSNEPLMLAGLALVAGVALIAEMIGLSLAVAAFIVGMVVSESNYRHHLADELRPLRDIFLGLFFLTIGMSVDWSIVLTEPAATVGAVVILVLVKLAIIFALARFSGIATNAALQTALVLAHGGEISLLILTQAIGGGLLPEVVAQTALAGTAVSIFLAPFLIQFNRRISAEVLSTPQLVAEPDDMIGGSAGDLRGHVILAGCGPVGRLVGTVLKASGIPYIAIERDVDRLRIAHREGHQVIFGDATRRGVLEAANIDTAAVVVALLNSQPRLEQLVRQVRQLNPAVPVLVSTRDNRGLTSIAKAGATYIFPENLAAGLGLAAQTFVALGVSPEEALARVRAVRLQLNPELRALRTI